MSSIWPPGIIAALLFTTVALGGQERADWRSTPGLANRIVEPVDDADRVPLPGNVHPLATIDADAGPLPAEQKLDQMVLVLRPDPARQGALSTLLTALQDRSSPSYHRFLTPEQFGDVFGASPDDIAAITGWLNSQGMQVDSVPEGRRTVIVSSTAAQVEAAFHTTLRRYNVGGEAHFANTTSPQVPAALAPVVEGIVSLHDFRAEPMHVRAQPEHTAGAYHYLAPADFATIYDIAPLYRQGINGAGESIAIVARSDVDINDIRSFRSIFSLPPGDPVIRFPGHDPGKGSSSDQAEATLDVEWAGAIAPNASILLVPAASSGSTDGAFLSAQYIVNKALAPILSMSFAECESALGSAGNSFLHALWEQAAAEGITVLVSSGDSGAAGCDSPASTNAGHGAAVNGICSSPDATCVGGTEFDDTASPALYWSAVDQSAHRSALGYVPEIAWNESAGTTLAEPSGFSLGSGLAATGGGPSRIYAKPPWQIGRGVPADGRRDVPDIALAAAAHDGYLVQLNGKTQVFSGTSVAVASFAGMLALLGQDDVQNGGAAQGNVNSKLYNLARRQSASPVFHDLSTGNNSVPGVTGYAANAGYDLATGLGSVDGQALLSAWNSTASIAPTLVFAISPQTLRLSTTSTAVANLTVASSDGSSLAAPAKMSVAGLPPGVTARFSPLTLGVPGTTTLTVSAARWTQPGSYPVQVTATPSDGSAAATVSFTLRVQLSSGFRPGAAAPVPAFPARYPD